MKTSFLSISLGVALAAVLLSSPCLLAHEATDNHLENNKKIAQQYFSELIEKEDPTYVDKLFHPDARLEFGPSWKSSVSGTNKISGLENLKKHFADIHSSKDITSETIDVVAQGDSVAIYRMTHETFPDGRKADIPWMSFFKIKDGKIISVHHVHDSLSQKDQHTQSLQTGTQK